MIRCKCTSLCLSYCCLISLSFDYYIIKNINCYCKIFCCCTIEMTLSWKLWCFILKRNHKIMKIISALYLCCVYVFIFIFIFICVYMYFKSLSGMKISAPFCFFPVITLNTADAHSSCYRSHSWFYSSICACLYNFVRTFIWSFIFIFCSIFHQDLISNPISLSP